MYASHHTTQIIDRASRREGKQWSCWPHALPRYQDVSSHARGVTITTGGGGASRAKNESKNTSAKKQARTRGLADDNDSDATHLQPTALQRYQAQAIYQAPNKNDTALLKQENRHINLPNRGAGCKSRRSSVPPPRTTNITSRKKSSGKKAA